MHHTIFAAVSNGEVATTMTTVVLLVFLAKPVSFEGWLWKKHQKAQLWSGWHQRYFVLRRSASTLVYHRSTNITSKCRGKIELEQTRKYNFEASKVRQFIVENCTSLIPCPTQSGSSMFMLGCVTQESRFLDKAMMLQQTVARLLALQ